MGDDVVVSDLLNLMYNFFVYFMIFCIIILLIYILLVIGIGGIFKKAGEDRWKSVIPFYRLWILGKISDLKKSRMIEIIIATIIALLFSVISSAVAFLYLINLMLFLVNLNSCLAKSFGRGDGTTIALCLFPGIVHMVLGLGKAPYISEKTNNNSSYTSVNVSQTNSQENDQHVNNNAMEMNTQDNGNSSENSMHTIQK